MKKKIKSKKTWIWEFSKKVLFILTILYIVERLFAMVLLIIDSEESLETFLTTGTEVFIAAVVGYLLKSAFENVQKIKNNPQEESEEEV